MGVGLEVALGVGLGVASAVGLARAASDATWVWVAMAVDARGAAITDGAVGGGDAEVNEEEQPATRMMTVSTAATEREIMPVMVLVAFRDAYTQGLDVSSCPVRQ